MEPNPIVKQIWNQFKLQTKGFNNVMDGITDTQSEIRIPDQVNNMKWIAGHIVSNRFQFSQVLGLPISYEFFEYFGRGKSFNENAEYPNIEAVIHPWQEVTDKLLQKVAQLTTAELEGEPPIKTPIEDPTFAGFMAFFTMHEAYHIGQLSLFRRIHGHSAMKYA